MALGRKFEFPAKNDLSRKNFRNWLPGILLGPGLSPKKISAGFTIHRLHPTIPLLVLLLKLCNIYAAPKVHQSICSTNRPRIGFQAVVNFTMDAVYWVLWGREESSDEPTGWGIEIESPDQAWTISAISGSGGNLKIWLTSNLMTDFPWHVVE